MATLDEITQEKEKLAERLGRLDAERTKLAEQLNELEIAERVLSRFGRSEATTMRGRGRPQAAPPAAHRPRTTRQPQARPPQVRAPAETLSLSDATLRAVHLHPEGVTAGDVLNYLSRELGMSVRPNHLGIALQRHRRAGRLDNRDQRWFPPQSAPKDPAAASP